MLLPKHPFVISQQYSSNFTNEGILTLEQVRTEHVLNV